MPGLDIYQVDSSDLGKWTEQKSLAVSIMAAVNSGEATSVWKALCNCTIPVFALSYAGIRFRSIKSLEFRQR